MADIISVQGADEEHTKQGLRQRIGVDAGYNYHGNARLPKAVLNSVYAYLTGEFLYPPRVTHDEEASKYVPKQAALQAVLKEAGVLDDPDEWVTRSGNFPRGMRRDELVELCREMEDRDDQRDWTP
jgi:hypothetical protein